MPKWAISLLIAGPILVIAIAASLIFEAAAPPESAAVFLRSPTPAAPNKPAQPISSPSKAAAAEMIDDASAREIARLKAENELLRRQLAIQQVPASRPESLDIEKLDAFAKKFILLKQNAVRDRDAKADLQNGPQTTAEYKLENTDLKRTDSVVNPLIGQIVFSQIRKYTYGSSYRNSMERYTLNFAYRDGKFQCINGQDECLWENASPEPENPRTGKTTSLGPDEWKDEIEAAQR